MIQSIRTKLLLAVILLAAVIWGFFFMNPAPTTKVSAHVVNADAVVKTVTIETRRGSQYVLPIPEYVVIKSIDTEGLAEGMMREEEINIYDLTAGLPVTVSTLSPFTEGDKEFPRIKEISTTEFVRTTVAAESKTDIFTPTKIENIDRETQSIEYGVSFPNSSKPTLSKLNVAGVPVYRVTDSSRAEILHARLPASFADLKAGDSIVIHFHITPAKFQPEEIVLVKNK